jgi:hypothetical protein
MSATPEMSRGANAKTIEPKNPQDQVPQSTVANKDAAKDTNTIGVYHINAISSAGIS